MLQVFIFIKPIFSITVPLSLNAEKIPFCPVYLLFDSIKKNALIYSIEMALGFYFIVVAGANSMYARNFFSLRLRWPVKTY